MRKILDAEVDWEGGTPEEMERRWVRGEQEEQVGAGKEGKFWGQKEERQWTTV